VLQIRDAYPDPGSWFLFIPDPGSQIPDPITVTKDKGEKNLWSYRTFFVARNIPKLKIILLLNCWRRIWAISQRIIEHFAQKFYIKLSKISVWDPDQKKNLFWIQDLFSHGSESGMENGSGIWDKHSGSATLHTYGRLYQRAIATANAVCYLNLYNTILHNLKWQQAGKQGSWTYNLKMDKQRSIARFTIYC
jgi:hypothetical protein